jgi:hypothetical protein
LTCMIELFTAIQGRVPVPLDGGKPIRHSG